ncbi:MAG: cysteine hydrolase [Nanoarchaeota archaeon]|nr:cysteine hydrolase [Nanoarchaeota archaeon]
MVATIRYNIDQKQRKGSKTTQEKLNPKQTALIVVDVQNDFCDEKGLFAKLDEGVSKFQKIIPDLLNLINEARKVNLPIIYIQAIYDKKYLPKNILERYKKQGLDKLCQSGTWGADFYKIKPKENEKVMVKHRYDAFTNPGLDKLLKSMKIKTLIMAGCTTDVCVDSTARTGFIKGYHIVAVEDCLATDKAQAQEYTLNYMKKFYDAIVIKSKEIVNHWKK